VKVSTGNYLHFLNPDTETRPGAFRAMIEFMNSHPEVGLAGTRMIYPDGSPQSSLERHYPGQRHAKRELSGLKGEVAWVLGASMVTRRDLFEAVGGFDEGFFLYGDDLDLCLRIRKQGWSIGFIPDALVVHWGGGSEQNEVPLEVWRKKLEAEFIFYRKHYSKRAIRAIRMENLIQAWWRILTLSMTIPFLKNKEKSYQKLEKYKLVFSTFRKKRTDQPSTDHIPG
jgi:GT2 family glycosyltransferase